MYFLFISEVKNRNVDQQGCGLEVFIQELISGLAWATQVTDKGVQWTRGFFIEKV